MAFRGRNAFDVSTFHRSNGIRDQREISGAPPQREAARRVPDGPCRSSPEHRLRGLETTWGASGGASHSARLDGTHAVQASRRGRRRGFCLGNRAKCAPVTPTVRLRLEERHPIGNPSQPRIGGPLSTARGLSTVLRACPLARVRDLVCPSSLVDHVPASAGQQLSAEA